MNKRSGEETRDKILAAALLVFTDQGYDAASMRMISQAAGISVGGLYLYFKNKTELYLTILKEWLDDLQRHTIESLAKARDPREEIIAFLSVTLQYARDHREVLILQRREMGCNRGSEVKQQFFQARRSMLADIIRRGIEARTFKICDPDEAARIIFNLIRGFVMSFSIDEEALFSTDACVDLILNGLARRNDA